MFGGALRVKPVSRKVIDAWPLKEAGLPVRVLNSVQPTGLQTVGELRAWSTAKLLKLRSLGRISIRRIQSFFEVADRIESGGQYIRHLREVFDLFLDHDEISVLLFRYGLDVEGTEASRKCMTLQDIGNRTNRTRERVRQIEETAKEKMRSRLAALCLQPFYDLFSQRIESLGKGVSCTEMQGRGATPALDNYNLCAVLLLLCDLHPELLTYYNGIFSTLSEKELKEIERLALARLESHKTFVPLEKIYDEVSSKINFVQGEALRKLLMILLDRNSHVAATTDNRYFPCASAPADFVRTIMETMPIPAHFREITLQCNQLLKSQSHMGSGFILKTLNSHPGFERANRGTYTIKQG
ncbi:MAG: hypothetical protein EOM20_01085 [Spartobacteria bacterium]|nr:hypothetical protein [Spartobacteria bacterium]